MKHVTPPLPAFEQVGTPLPPFTPWIPTPRAALYDPRINDFDRRLLGILADQAGRNALESVASNTKLAALMSCGEQSIRMALAKLEAAGYVARVEDPHIPGTRRRIDFLYRTWDPGKGEDRAATGCLDTPISAGVGASFEGGGARHSKGGGRAIRRGGGAPFEGGGHPIREKELNGEKENVTFAPLEDPRPPTAEAAPIAEPVAGAADPGQGTAEQVAALEAELRTLGRWSERGIEVRFEIARLKAILDPKPTLPAAAPPPPVDAPMPPLTPRVAGPLVPRADVPGGPPPAAGPPVRVDAETLMRRLVNPAFPPGQVVAELGERLAALNNDRKSLGYYRGVLGKIAAGGIPLEVGVEALRAGLSPTGRTAGALFADVIRRWESGAAPPGKEKPACVSPLRRSHTPAQESFVGRKYIPPAGASLPSAAGNRR